MERDYNLLRRLVLSIERDPHGYAPHNIKIDGYSDEEIGYHNYLLVDSELAVGVDATTLGSTSPEWRILHLTSAGHDFADAIRDEIRWKKATSIVKDKAGSVSLDVLKQLLISLLKNTLGL